MIRILFILALLCLEQTIHAQYIYTIKADSVKITNSCDTAELIIENHTQDVCGFLFNKGKGRTEFRRGMIRFNDSTSLIGCDTLKLNAWLQGGNRFGTIGSFGTMDNNPIDFYSNGIKRARLTNSGSLLIGNSPIDNGEKLQVGGTRGAVTILANLSRNTDRIQIGNNLNSDDGQNAIIRTSNDNGATYKNILVERDGYIGLGTTDNPKGGWNVGAPALRIFGHGTVMVSSSSFYFGQPWGNYNSSCLKTYVSNLDEWDAGIGNYPSRKNYYYFGTFLGGQEGTNERADLRIGGRNIRFYSGGIGEGAEAASISENQNLLLGTSTDNGNKLQVVGNSSIGGNLSVTGSGVIFSGLSANNNASRILAADANGNLYYRDASSLALNETMNSDLAVNGRVSAQQMLITQTGRWPDYVFSKQYKLPSLTEVENFINQNSHLPGVPSAAEVEKKGIDVGNNQAALLKKIEELTLYIIDQDKTIKKQNDQISDLLSLKQEMAELKALLKNK